MDIKQLEVGGKDEVNEYLKDTPDVKSAGLINAAIYHVMQTKFKL